MGLGCSVLDKSPAQSTAQIRGDAETSSGRRPTSTSSRCDSGVAMTSSSRHSVTSPSDRPESDRKSAAGELDGEQKGEEQQRTREVIIIEGLQREDGDGAVDEDDRPPVEIVNVDNSRMASARYSLTPIPNTPPTSPPPARSTTPPSGSTVELRVETQRCASGGNNSRSGSRPTSSKHRPPSVVTTPRTTSSTHRPPSVVTTPRPTSSTHRPPSVVTTPRTTSSKHRPPSVVTTPRPTSSKHRPPSVVTTPRATSSKHRPPSVVTAPRPTTVDVGEELQTNTAAISGDNTATAKDSEDAVRQVHASEEAAVDRISLKARDSQPNSSSPPATLPSGSSVEAKRCSSSSSRRGGDNRSRPTSSKSRPPTPETEVVNHPEVASDENAAKARQKQAPVDRISVKAEENQQDHMTDSAGSCSGDATTADLIGRQVQPEVASADHDNQPEVSDFGQQETQTPEQPNTKVRRPKVVLQAEAETANTADQPETSTSAVVGDDTIAKLPEKETDEQPNAGLPTTESVADKRERSTKPVQRG